MNLKSNKKIVLPFLVIVIVLVMLFGVFSLIGAEIGGKPSLVALDVSPKSYVLLGDTSPRPRFIPPPERFLNNAPQTAVIDINYIGTWDAGAQAAVEYAADIWETLITSTVPISVTAEWVPLDPGVLGSARASDFFRNVENQPVSDTWYPSALADKLAGNDLDPGNSDIQATFNSAFTNWYFATDGNPPGDKIDFVSVVMHEIGHGLGFVGSFFVDDGTSQTEDCGGAGLGCWGFGTPYPFIYDYAVETGNGTKLLSFPNFSEELADLLTGDDLFFDAPYTRNANSGPAKLYAPASWQQGSSFSHLSEVAFPPGNASAMMTPILNFGEAHHNPGPVGMGVFEDIGWKNFVACRDECVFMPMMDRDVVTLPTPTPTLPPPDEWEIIKRENFDGAFPNQWTVDDFGSSGSGSGFWWGERTCEAFNGANGGWAVGAGPNGSGLNCGANYPNNASSWMVFGPFSLEGTHKAELNAKTIVNTDSSADVICRLASIDGSDFDGWCTFGTSNGTWLDLILDLDNVPIGNNQFASLLGEPNVWVAYWFGSDSAGRLPDGAHLDKIILQKCNIGDTCQSSTQPIILPPGVGEIRYSDLLELQSSER